MKWFFYIFGILTLMLVPSEFLSGPVGLITIGIAFHINDVKDDILARIDKMEKTLKRDIKDLDVKK